MKHIYKILLTAITLAAAPLVGMAQNDSPLYINVISDDIDARIDTASNVHRSEINKKEQQKADNDAALLSDSENIGEQLRNLNRLYLAGKYEEALQLSQSIRENFHDLNIDDESKRQMFTIAALKDMEYNEKADSATRRFLGRNPFYKAKSDDPIPFQENLSNYYTTPKYSIWVGLGQTIAIPSLDTVHVITDTINIKPDYQSENDVSVQIGFEYHPWQFLSIAIAPTYTSYKYSRSVERSERSTFHYEESDKIFSLPVRVEGYLFTGEGKWVPSAYLGAKIKYLYKSKYNSYTQTAGEPQYRVDSKEHDLDCKTKINYAVLGGVKLSFNYNRLTIFGDLGISYDIKPFNNPKAALSNTDLAYDKMYLPDIFHIVELTAMVGIKVNLKYKTVAKYGYGH